MAKCSARAAQDANKKTGYLHLQRPYLIDHRYIAHLTQTLWPITAVEVL